MRDISTETFEEVVIESDRPCIVDFWGPQWASCLSLMPQLEALEEKYGDKIDLVKIEASKNRPLCVRLKVFGLPSFLFFKNSQEVERLTGQVTIRSIEDGIQRII